MSIARDNQLFSFGVSIIRDHAKSIESAAHLFDSATKRRYSTALDKMDLRASARALREAADKVDEIAGRLGQQEAYPDSVKHLQAAE